MQDVPLLGSLRVRSGKAYACMDCPVGLGSSTSVDTGAVISSMDPWLRSQRLAGIRTAKADCLNK